MSSFWADEVAARTHGPQVVNDSKTPSGTVHVGSLRGVVIHDAIVRALRDAGRDVRFLYGIDDLDAMDSATLASREGLTEHMGRPLKDVPAPAGSVHRSWARHFGHTFLDTFARLGVEPEFYWGSELYESGAHDAFIAEALDRAAHIRRVYLEISKSRKPDDWHPLFVMCERCGRIGTTYVHAWDGREVSYRCLPDLVAWARGCGNTGRISPFGGRAKLPWNLDWVAKWRHFGVTIEGSGKDLSTAGGSRPRSDAIARDLFGFDPPLNVPYEFLLVGGRKMKSSAGTGTPAHTMAEALPAELLRFLMLRYRPHTAIEFDPAGETIPRLFEEYDLFAAEAAAADGGDAVDPLHVRIIEMSQLPGRRPPRHFLPPFAQVATYAQVPTVSLPDAIARHRGAALEPESVAELRTREAVARRWLAQWAPERYRFSVELESVPPAVASLSPAQRDYLRSLATRLDRLHEWAGETLQAEVFEESRASGLTAGEAFGAIYAAFVGKRHGPRAGWLLASLPRGFVIDRLRTAAVTAFAPDTVEAGT